MVHKYGGTSVADLDRIRAVAARIKADRDAGSDVVVVVSAMAGETDRLLKLAVELQAEPERRELDMLLSTGEQVTIALLSMCLIASGCRARSRTGSQVVIRTDGAHTRARIEAIDEARIRQDLAGGQVVVVAGFQGVTGSGEITTLGRGGSDTTAVALAAALGADECRIYTDVDGVYTGDPRIVADAKRLQRITYEEMLELASLGAKVLQIRAVEFASKYGVRLRVLSSFVDGEGTLIVPDNATSKALGIPNMGNMGNMGNLGSERPPLANVPIAYGERSGSGAFETSMPEQPSMRRHQTGTHEAGNIEDRSQARTMEQPLIAGVAHNRDEAKLTVLGVPDRPGVAYQILGPIADASIDVDMIVQNASLDGTTDFTFTVHRRDYQPAMRLLREHAKELDAREVAGDDRIAKISLVGVGMRSHAGIASRMFKALAAEGINIQMISTSEIKISVVVDERYLELGVRTLHEEFNLGNGNGDTSNQAIESDNQGIDASTVSSNESSNGSGDDTDVVRTA
ncbi:MAG: aspartate kinase [Gammaproteobacteria bacterium]